jgi:hypothetical protein
MPSDADQDRGFSVLLEHRPRCVAFVVDLDSVNDDLIDAIVDFNVDSWGGRFNPIILSQNKKICSDYWRLLKLASRPMHERALGLAASDLRIDYRFRFSPH